MSAMICVQYGPITMAVRSITRTPASGPVLAELAMKCASIAGTLREFEAVADVLVMTVGYDRNNQRRLNVSNRIEMFADILDRPGWPIHAGAFSDDRARHPTRQRDEHLPGHRTGFVREPTHHGRNELRAHRWVGRGVDACCHSRHRGRDHHDA